MRDSYHTPSRPTLNFAADSPIHCASTARCLFASFIMEASGDRITEKVQSLSDLELAVLICLVADQHCIIESEEESTRDVQEELKLVSCADCIQDSMISDDNRSRPTCSDLPRQSSNAMRILPLTTLEMASWSKKRGMTILMAKLRGRRERFVDCT